jgi:hypothetical protein
VVRILREDPPSLDSVAPGLPPQLVKAVMKALAKEPENRFKTAGEMAKELQWIRQALQASVQSPGALEETRFATPAQLAELQKELEKDRIAAGEPRPEYETEAAAPAAGRKSLVPAIVGVAAVILAVVAYVWFGRTPPASDPNTKPASVATPGTKDVPQKPEPPAVAETVSLRVESTPPGAAVSLDGRPTNQTTPTTLSLPSAGAHRLSLSKVGFVTQEVNLAEADLKQGLVKYALAPAEETGVPVTIESTYPVEVISGSRTISRASQSHRLRVPAGATLRITAKEYLLNATLRASGPSVSYQAPGIGHLTVLTRHETCNVKIGERVLGFPPITRMPIAAGQYRIDIACPTGQNPPGQFVTIAPNETATARIF